MAKDFTFDIVGLDCPMCAEKIAEHIAKSEGIVSASIDFGAGKLYVKADKADIVRLQSLVGEVEDEIIVKPVAKKEGEGVLNKKFWINVARLASSLVILLLSVFVFNEERFGLWVNLGVSALAWFICSYSLVYKVFMNVIRLRNPIDENLLMLLASIGGFCLRFFGPDHNEFMDAVLVVWLSLVGEMFEDVATERSHKAIVDAVGLRAQFAHRLDGSSIVDVSPESLKIGDEVLVKVGEILPADGRIVEGEGAVDMSSLTGEFAPVMRKTGDEVNSGTILSSGSIKVSISKTYADSTVSKIAKLVEESGRNKSKTDRFISKFARVYTPIVFLLALAIGIVLPLCIDPFSGETWSHYLFVAICALVISCPCAIVVSVPLAFFSGIGLASKRGIIVKGGGFLEKLASMGHLFTDKTGTLTKGRFEITVKKAMNCGEEELMKCLRLAECRSSHPIAKAILEGHEAGPLSSLVESYEELPGKGVKVISEGKTIYAGSLNFLAESGIECEESLDIGTIVYAASDGEYLGYVALTDEIRPESMRMVDFLKAKGIGIGILTGDKLKSAQPVAATLGIEEVHAGLLPDEKTELLRQKIENSGGKPVAYMGDGINDAPSIILADVGIAMGGAGSDLAIENADVVIMNDDPSKLVTVHKIAKKTKARAIMNIAIALGLKLAVMLLAFLLPGFPLFTAVAADTGLTVALVFSSLLLLTSKVK